jgi:integrase/recombinase XerD
METLGQDFLKHLRNSNYSDHSLDSYKKNIDLFINFIGERKIEELVYSDIEEFKSLLIGRFAPASVNQSIYTLRSFFKYVRKQNVETKVNFRDISGVKEVSGPKYVPNISEIEKILASPNKFERSKELKRRNRAILEVIFATGARINEVLNLKLLDIGENDEILIVGKGKKRRTLYLNQRSKHFLDEYLVKRSSNSPYLFAPIRGRRGEKEREKVDDSTFRWQLSGYIKNLGLGIKVTAHTLRAAFATKRLENGANLDSVRIALGHSSLATTQRYLALSDKFVKNDLQKADPLRNYK